jgi:hypothetical protein
MDKSKYKPAVIRQAFIFLVNEFGYSIVRDEELSHENRPYVFVIDYVGNKRKVNLTYDYKENFFYFSISRINSGFIEKISSFFGVRESNIIFWKLFRYFEPSLELKAIQPDGQTCEEAALVNAQLLKKYASDILRGEKWI